MATAPFESDSQGRSHGALFVAIALTLVAMAAALALTVRYNAPPRKARRQLLAGQPQRAFQTVEAACLTRCSPELRSLQAVALHGLEKHRDELAILSGLDDAELSKVDPLALAGLAEDFGRNERDPALRALLSRLPADRLRSGLERLAADPRSPARWGALRYLDETKAAGAAGAGRRKIDKP